MTPKAKADNHRKLQVSKRVMFSNPVDILESPERLTTNGKVIMNVKENRHYSIVNLVRKPKRLEFWITEPLKFCILKFILAYLSIILTILH